MRVRIYPVQLAVKKMLKKFKVNQTVKNLEKNDKTFLKKKYFESWDTLRYPGYAVQKFCVSLSVYGIRRILRIRISRIRIFWNTEDNGCIRNSWENLRLYPKTAVFFKKLFFSFFLNKEKQTNKKLLYYI